MSKNKIMDSNNSDSKGVKRGICQSCDDCPQFEWKIGIENSSCTYCGCLPVKHLKCVEMNEEIANFLRDDNDEISYQKVNHVEKITVKPVYDEEIETENAGTSASTIDKNEPSSSINETNDFSYLIPHKFPDSIQKLIDARRKLSEVQKSTIIRLTALNMNKAGLDQPFIILEIAILLSKKFPDIFLAPYGDPYETTRSKLKNCCKYLKSKNNNSDGDNFKKSIVDQEKKPSLKKDLRSTRNSRMADAGKLNADQFLKKYPALQKNEMLLWELGDRTNLPVEKLRENWLDAMPRIIAALQCNANSFDENGKSISTLVYLPKLFTKSKETGKILNFHANGTPISDTVPDVKEAPKLIAINNGSFNELEVMCYVDAKPIFQAKGFEAVLLLVAVYWVFQVAFPVKAKQQFAFISIAVLRDVAMKDIGKEILSKVTLNSALKLCGLLPEKET